MSTDEKRRTHGPGRRSRRISVIHIAGWLFADLMLVLFTTTFTSVSVTPPPPRPAAAPTTVRSSAPASPSPSPGSTGQVLVLVPVEYHLTRIDTAALEAGDTTGPAAEAVISSLNRQLHDSGHAGQPVGLVEAFGDSPSSGGAGILVARTLAAILVAIPAFAHAYTQNYWESGSDGDATVQVFFFQQ